MERYYSRTVLEGADEGPASRVPILAPGWTGYLDIIMTVEIHADFNKLLMWFDVCGQW